MMVYVMNWNSNSKEQGLPLGRAGLGTAARSGRGVNAKAVRALSGLGLRNGLEQIFARGRRRPFFFLSAQASRTELVKLETERVHSYTATYWNRHPQSPSVLWDSGLFLLPSPDRRQDRQVLLGRPGDRISLTTPSLRAPQQCKDRDPLG
jgi:hypothetical protein